MFESPVKQSKSVARGRQTTSCYSVYSVVLILTRGRDVSHSANAISTGYCKFSLPRSHSAPSFRVTPFEFMEKLYGSIKLESSRQPTVKIW